MNAQSRKIVLRRSARNGEQYLLGACVGESVTLHEVAARVFQLMRVRSLCRKDSGDKTTRRSPYSYRFYHSLHDLLGVAMAAKYRPRRSVPCNYTSLSRLLVSLGSGKAAPQQSNRDTELTDPLSRKSYNSSRKMEPLMERNGSEVKFISSHTNKTHNFPS